MRGKDGKDGKDGGVEGHLSTHFRLLGVVATLGCFLGM